MKVLIDYNDCQNVMDVSPEIVRLGVIQIAIDLPLQEKCVPCAVPPQNREFHSVAVYATGGYTTTGMPIFSNRRAQ